ncbi:MAG: hypothetical protein JXJ04_11010 [Spirochaetales bacterium]|nr:hypothetical protein [Spirochaetales bacterium]
MDVSGQPCLTFVLKGGCRTTSISCCIDDKRIREVVTDVEEIKTEELIEETPPEPTEKPKKQRFISFSASIDCGGDIPVSDSSLIFKTAIMPLILLDIELNFTLRNLGFGL